jgi:MFS family permease
MFTRYSNQERQGYEWSVYDTIISLATAVTAAIGAYIAEAYSFRYLFVFVGFLSLVGTAFIVTIFKNEFTTLPSWGRLMVEPTKVKKRRRTAHKKKKYARVRAS